MGKKKKAKKFGLNSVGEKTIHAKLWHWLNSLKIPTKRDNNNILSMLIKV